MSEEVTPLQDFCCQLSDKALVDYVNATQVGMEIVRVRSARKGFRPRALAWFNGRDQAERAMLETCLAEGQMTTIQWLTSLQSAQAEGDLALSTVSRVLKALKSDTAVVSAEATARMEAIETRLAELQSRHDDLSRAHTAGLGLEQVLSEAKRLSSPAFAVAFAVADRLWWGKLGDFVRSPGSQGEAAALLLKNATLALGELLADRLGQDVRTLVSLSVLALKPDEMAASDTELMRYLGSTRSGFHSPLHDLLTRDTFELEHLPLSLPRKISADRIAERLMSEARQVSKERSNANDLSSGE